MISSAVNRYRVITGITKTHHPPENATSQIAGINKNDNQKGNALCIFAAVSDEIMSFCS